MSGVAIPFPQTSRTSARALVVAIAGLTILSCTPVVAQQDDNPAHAIADKFAGASEPDVEVLEKIKIIKQMADDARAKTRVKRASPNHDAAKQARAAAIRKAAEEKVAEQTAADEKRRAAKLEEDQRKEQERKADLVRKTEQKREADLARAAEQNRIAEAAKRHKELEASQALKARQAEASARKAQARAAARQNSQNRMLAAQEAERRRQMEESRQRDWQRAAEHSRAQARERARARKELERRRHNEARSLSDRLRRARESRPSGLGAGGLKPSQEPSPQGFGVSRPPASIVSNDHRVAILLIMDVGKKGIRRWSKTADPMICINDNCYLSKGAKTHSRKLSRRKAFGPSVALGSRGLACRSKPACIFRGVDLGGPSAPLQPVDLRIIRHDRRTPHRVKADQDCAIVRGRLTCGTLIAAAGWRAWVIPESVAEWAGPTVLEAALAKGLR